MHVATDQSILHYFARLRVMDDGHISGGITFLDWKEAYYAMHGGMKTSRFRVPQNSGAGEDKASKYLLLVKALGQETLKTLEKALWPAPVTPGDRKALYALRFRYQEAFEKLGKAIEEANEKLSSCETMRPGLELVSAEV